MQSEKTKSLIPVPAFGDALIDTRFDIAQAGGDSSQSNNEYYYSRAPLKSALFKGGVIMRQHRISILNKEHVMKDIKILGVDIYCKRGF
ncbi:hypothetical protein, partial [Coxiella endosymbiont of Ornithodoros amblus]|uniref:hypothetical protein n=1 Tax=Coxiella endosymbiont of Ornithodoros amblus TaxID=1656166 RepID=UPI00244E4D35